MATIRVKDMEQGTPSGAFVLLDAADGTTKKPLSEIEDDAANKATSAVAAITAAAQSAAAQALDAKNAANAATTAANTATTAANTATEAANAAIEAMGDISELAVPTMSASTRGGAKLGDGLDVSGDVLSLGNLVKSGSGSSVETDGCALFSVEGEGWSEQTVTTGKNLWPHGDKTVTQLSSISLPSTPAGTYTFSADFSTEYTGQTVRVLLRSYDSGTGNYTELYSAYFNNVAGRISAVLSPAAVFNNIVLYSADGYASGEGKTATYKNIQLESGSQATSYEPYTGGAPAPSPSYPMPIRTAKSRNLLDESTLRRGDYNNTTETTRVSQNNSDRAKVKPGETYTLSFGPALHGWLLFTDESNNLYNVQQNNLPSPLTATVPSGATRACLIFSKANSSETVTVEDVLAGNPQLVKGSIPMPYVPYGHVGLEVDLASTTAYEQGTATGTVGNTYEQNKQSTTLRFRTADLVPVDTPSAYVSVASGYKATVAGYLDGKFVRSLVASWMQAGAFDMTGLDSVAVTVKKDDDSEVSSTDMVNADVRIVQSPTPVPLPSKGFAGAAGDYSDALTIDSAGRWEWVNGVDEVLDASTLTVSSDATGDSSPHISMLLPSKAVYSNSICKSSHYINRFSNDSGSCYVTSSAGLAVAFANSTFASQADAVQKLAGVTFLYALATPAVETGFVDLPMLPNGAVISCPELQEIGVEWYVEGCRPLMEHAANERKRLEALIAEATS